MATELIPAAPAIAAPCVVFALRRESMYFRRAYPFQQCFSAAPCRAETRGRNSLSPEKSSPGPWFLMLESGVGAAAMETALRWCLSGPRFGDLPYRPRFLISAGFSGALQPELRIGDLLLANEIIDEHGNRWLAHRPDALAEYGISAGRVLAMPELIGNPQEKQRLGQRYAAAAVDMESAAAARFCHEHKVPFICLRVISDDCQTALSPHLADLLQRGLVSVPRLIGQVSRHPKLIGELWRLAGQTRHAARQLLRPLSVLLASLAAPSEPD